MAQSFKAGSAFIEVSAETKRLQAKMRSINRDVPKDFKKIGRKSGKDFASAFEPSQRAKDIAAKFRSGMVSGVKGLGSAMAKSAKLGLFLSGSATAFGVLAKKVLSSTAEIKIFADNAALSTEKFTELSYATRRYGLDTKETSDAIRDMNDRVEDFAATGGGPLTDFFERIGPLVGVTIEDFRKLSGDQAMGLYISSLEKAGVQQKDMAFWLEAIGGDLTKLYPLYRNNSQELNRLKTEASDVGAVLTDDMAQGAFDANAELERLGSILRSGVTNAIVEAAPEIEAITTQLIGMVPHLLNWADAAIDGIKGLRDEWNSLPFSKGGDGKPSTTLDGIRSEKKDLAELLELADKLDGKNGFLSFLTGKDKLNFQRKGVLENRSFNKNDIGKAQQQDAILGGNDAYKKLIRDRLKNLTATSLSEMQKIIDEGIVAEATAGGKPASGSGGVQYSSKKDKKSKSASTQLSDDFRDSLRETQEELREYARIVEDAMTPMQEYEAARDAINRGEAIGAIDAESASRARAQAIQELAGEVGNLDAAYTSLGEAIAKDQITQAQAEETMAALNEERKTQTEDAAQAEIDKRLEIIDVVLQETEAKLELARLSGNPENLAALESELSMLHEKRRLLEGGASDADASKGAADRQFDVDAARMEGQARDAFKAGFHSLLDGDFEGGLSDMLSRAAGGMFDKALDSLLDNLFDNLSSGNGGGLLSSFAGLFDKGGNIPGGSWGIAGENGPEIIQGPARITSTADTARMIGGSVQSQATGGKSRIDVHVTTNKYLDAMVQETAVDTTNTLAPMHAQGAVAQAQRNQSMKYGQRL